jgi:biotin transport system substrate-specific component
MSINTQASTRTAEIAVPVLVPGSLPLRLLVALVGSGLLWLSAKIQVPFWPVPMTFQTATVMLLGIALGWRLALGTVFLYLAEGAAGLPVFAGTPQNGLGLAYMAGPTGGYLLGFAAAACVSGWATLRSGSVLVMAAGLLLATMTVYVFGGSWLSLFVGPVRAFEFGVLPFLLGDALKLLLVLAIWQAGSRGLDRWKAST